MQFLQLQCKKLPDYLWWDDLIFLFSASSEDNKIFVYDGQSNNSEALHCFEKLHSKPVVMMKVFSQIFNQNMLLIFFLQFNIPFATVVSVDQAGIVEYWTGYHNQFKTPNCVKFESKLDTSLYEFAKCKTYPSGLCFSPDGQLMATLAVDRKVWLSNCC